MAEASRLAEYLGIHRSGGPWKSGPSFEWRHPPGLPVFPVAPTLRIARGSTPEFERIILAVAKQVNGALPADRQLAIGAPSPPRTMIDDIPDGQIFADFTTTSDDWNPREGATYRPGSTGLADQAIVPEWNAAEARWENVAMRASRLWLSAETPPKERFSIMLHEMIHALGLSGHVPHVRFPDSIMRDSFLLVTGCLPPIDAAALRAAYLERTV